MRSSDKVVWGDIYGLVDKTKYDNLHGAFIVIEYDVDMTVCLHSGVP